MSGIHLYTIVFQKRDIEIRAIFKSPNDNEGGRGENATGANIYL